MMKSHLLSAARAVALSAGVVMAPTSVKAADPVPGVTNDAIKVGFFGALTGPYYLYGALVMDGAQLVYDQVNEAGGIHGRKIVTVRSDDRCDAASAIGAAKQLIHQEDVFMIHGGGCSNPALSALPTIEKAEVPWVIFAAVADELTQPAKPYVWRTALSASTESRAQVEYALRSDAKRIGIVWQQDPWGRSRYDPMIDQLKKNGIKPVVDVEMTVDANDATPQVLRMKQADVDVVLLVVYPKPAAIFLRDAHKVGYKPLAVGSTAISGLQDLRQQIGGGQEAVERVVAVSHVKFSPEAEEAQQWRDAFEKRYPDKKFGIYTLFGIASGKVVAEALERAGRELTRQKFRETMDNLTGFDTGVYGGTITCSPEVHQCHRTASFVGLEGDTIVTRGMATVE